MISTEHLMQMGPMLVLAALMMGLLAETVWRAGGNGLLNDMILGLAGTILAVGCEKDASRGLKLHGFWRPLPVRHQPCRR